jgi:AcrR family transcriptional regulator
MTSLTFESLALGSSDRDRLIRAMVEICAEQGYGAATSEALSERSGVGRERLVELFGAEQAPERCLLAAHGAIVGDVIAAVSSVYENRRSGWENTIAGLQAILEYMAANPSAAHTCHITAPRGAPERIRVEARSARRMLVTMLERVPVLEDGSGAHPQAAVAALGSAEALIRREILAGRAEALPRALPEIVFAIAVPYRGGDGAACLAALASKSLEETPWRGRPSTSES